MKKRPFGVTVLAILAGIAAVLAAVHALQSLGIFPYVLGGFQSSCLQLLEFLDVGPDGLGVGLGVPDALAG